jgi:hypothetical protein
MLTTKIRTIIAVSTVTTALASSGAASAASVAPQTSTTTTVAAAPPTATAPCIEYTILVGVVVLIRGILPGASG